MNKREIIWVFTGEGGVLPSGAFTSSAEAEEWIIKHKLSGSLREMPLGKGIFEWALEKNFTNMSEEEIEAKSKDPKFIQTFVTHSLEARIYENGIKWPENT